MLHFRALSSSTSEDRRARDQKQQEKVIQLWIFLGCTLGILTLVNLLCTLGFHLRKRSLAVSPIQEINAGKDAEKLSSMTNPSLRVRSTTTLATCYRIVSFRFIIPVGFGQHLLFSEITFICVYMASLLIWLLEDTRDLTVMFYEDRAAHLAACQIPLIVALAGKNNIISFFTGVSHEKLNILHRAASRSILLLLWLHALTRIITGLPAMFDFTHDWVVAGAVGLGALTLVVILSLGPIRTAAFELFFVSHIILVFIFLVAAFYHTHEQDMGGYIWPALVLWAVDRILRGLKIVWNNRLWVRGESKYSLATVELVSSDTIRLSLSRRFSWRAGQHAYVTLPTISKLPFEAHPFTIASIPAQRRTDNVNESEDNAVVFLVRGRSGMTGRLRRFAARGTGTTTIPALIDGPYGNPPNLLTFSTSVFIAGGSGISYTLPLLLDLLRSAAGGVKSEIRRVAFIWAIRDVEHLHWISKILADALETIPPTLSVEPRVYVTGSRVETVPVLSMVPTNTSGEADMAISSASANRCDAAATVEEKSELPVYSVLKIIHGRPSIRKLLHDEISASTGVVSVNVAGPTSLSDSVRRALSGGIASPLATMRGMPSVTLHVEKFGM